MSRFVLVLLCVVFAMPAASYAQPQLPAPASQEMVVPKRDAFYAAMIKAIKAKRQKGEMSARQALRLRVALISPAFRAKAEDLAVTQMAFSEQGEDYLKRTAEGKVDRASIDWEGVTLFLEKLMPFLLQLLELLAVSQPTTIFV